MGVAGSITLRLRIRFSVQGVGLMVLGLGYRQRALAYSFVRLIILMCQICALLNGPGASCGR